MEHQDDKKGHLLRSACIWSVSYACALDAAALVACSAALPKHGYLTDAGEPQGLVRTVGGQHEGILKSIQWQRRTQGSWSSDCLPWFGAVD